MKKIGVKKQLGGGKGNQNRVRVSDDYNGNYWQLFDIKLFSRDRLEVLKTIESKIDFDIKRYWIATVNPEFVMETTKNSDFKQILSRTSLNVMDGIGLIWAKALNEKYQETITKKQTNNVRVFLKKVLIGFKVGGEVLRGKYKDQVASGADLMLDLVKMASKKDKKIFLLGGWGDRAERTARYFSIKYQAMPAGRQVSSIKYSAGEPEIENKEVIKQINDFKPDILLVAYGMKKQEFWIDKYLNKLDVGLVMGVGRSFDYYSGELKRAPEGWRKMGMEWLYSLIKEPKRIKRQLVLPKFVWKVLTK